MCIFTLRLFAVIIFQRLSNEQRVQDCDNSLSKEVKVLSPSSVAFRSEKTFSVVILIILLCAAMSEVTVRSNVWVKIAKETIWWPSTIIRASSDNITSSTDLIDPFSGVGVDQLIIVKFLGMTDECIKVAALKLSDRGKSWDLISDADHKYQIIPASMRMLYDSAVSMLGNIVAPSLELNLSDRFDSISMETPIKVNMLHKNIPSYSISPHILFYIRYGK